MSDDEDEWYDPRTQQSVTPKIDDLYGDARHKNDDGTFEQQFRVVYCDDEVVLLRSNQTLDRKRGHLSTHYRLEHRDTFEQESGAGRYKRVEESADAPPSSDDIHYHMGIVKRRIAHYDEKPGRTADHKKEALEELLELLESFDAEEMDWTSVDTIGEKAAGRLKEAGFVTDQDVRIADRDELLDVNHVGESGVENLKSYVES